jgi:hypothetical protein
MFLWYIVSFLCSDGMELSLLLTHFEMRTHHPVTDSHGRMRTFLSLHFFLENRRYEGQKQSHHVAFANFTLYSNQLNEKTTTRLNNKWRCPEIRKVKLGKTNYSTIVRRESSSFPRCLSELYPLFLPDERKATRLNNKWRCPEIRKVKLRKTNYSTIVRRESSSFSITN